MGTFSDKNLLKLVFFIIKSSCYNSQIEDFLKSAAPISKMRQRDSLKKIFDITKDEHIWNQYKKARNETNNLIKQSKRNHFTSNIEAAGNDPKKLGSLLTN